MGICALPTADKQLVARRVGSDLVKKHGKRRYYSVDEIKDAARRQNIPDAWDCWALSLYTSPNDFVDHHTAIGESCDYAAMHSNMMNAVATDITLPGMEHLASMGSAIPDGEHHANVAHSMLDAFHHSSTDTGSSWFSDLLDAVSNFDFTDFHH